MPVKELPSFILALCGEDTETSRLFLAERQKGENRGGCICYC